MSDPSNHENEHEPWLDNMLRENNAYIDDDGFTQRVMDSLPAPRRRAFRWRAMILMTSAVLAALLVVFLLPGATLVRDTLWQIAAYRPLQSPVPVLPAVVLALIIGSGVAAAVTE